MRIVHNNIAVLDYKDALSEIVERLGVLESQDGPCNENLRLLHEGDWVVDGGAALGDHTAAYLKRVGISGRVFAFEPHPDYFECLKHNCPGAVLINAALYNLSGSVGFSKDTGLNQGASAVRKDSKESVLCVMLDDLKLERLNLLKLDVEGCELQALLGATETVCRCSPIIQIEWNPAACIDPTALLHWFDLCDYSKKCFMGSIESGGEIIAFPQKKCQA